MNIQISNTLEGKLDAGGIRFGIVCSRFNDFFVKQLLDGAVDCILRHGGQIDQITLAWVPGSYEIPLIAQCLAEQKKIEAIIALGVVISGATTHAEYINSFVSNKLGDISTSKNIPIAYGIVTAETMEQAVERSGSKLGNKGASAALSAIEMANLMKGIRLQSKP